MRKYVRDYQDELYLRDRYIRPNMPRTYARNVTFQVTDDCCLKCSYCYQTHKGHRMMTVDTAKNICDLLFELYDKNEPNAVINHETTGIILEFIGGEPFMNVPVIEQAFDYFLNKCYALNHPWLTACRISISSNGLLYFEPDV
jgi:sulfatase maturation enzyme AslB (radical SAM superfamily)